MKVLVVGGTRLLGQSVVRHLLDSQHLVTVLSRRVDACPAAARCLGMDRRVGLRRLAGELFDIVIDFLAYDGAAAAEALVAIPDAIYILISTSWMIRLHPGISVDQPVTTIVRDASKRLPAVTRDYLLSKKEAESVVFRARQDGRGATVLRLPIFLGEGDHTGRIGFYKQRSSDGGATIAIDGGQNLAQVAWTEDLARALLHWLPLASRHPIWDGLPDRGLPARQIMALIAHGMGRMPSVVDVPRAVLAQHLPDYLECEPLWREVSIPLSERNIFSTTATVPTPHSEWLCGLEGAPDPFYSALREKELAFIERLAA